MSLIQVDIQREVINESIEELVLRRLASTALGKWQLEQNQDSDDESSLGDRSCTDAEDYAKQPNVVESDVSGSSESSEIRDECVFETPTSRKSTRSKGYLEKKEKYRRILSSKPSSVLIVPKDLGDVSDLEDDDDVSLDDSCATAPTVGTTRAAESPSLESHANRWDSMGSPCPMKKGDSAPCLDSLLSKRSRSRMSSFRRIKSDDYEAPTIEKKNMRRTKSSGEGLAKNHASNGSSPTKKNFDWGEKKAAAASDRWGERNSAALRGISKLGSLSDIRKELSRKVDGGAPIVLAKDPYLSPQRSRASSRTERRRKIKNSVLDVSTESPSSIAPSKKSSETDLVKMSALSSRSPKPTRIYSIDLDAEDDCNRSRDSAAYKSNLPGRTTSAYFMASSSQSPTRSRDGSRDASAGTTKSRRRNRRHIRHQVNPALSPKKPTRVSSRRNRPPVEISYKSSSAPDLIRLASGEL